MINRVTVVIPTWNRGDLLAACLDSLDAQTFQAYSVIVVDDASTDRSIDSAVAGRATVRVIRHETNRGFAVSANRGLREASTELVVLMNNDVTLAPDALEKLVASIDAGVVDMVQPLILWQNEPDMIYSAGDRQNANGRPESIGFRAHREGFQFDEPVFGVTAAAALYKRAVFDRIGYLDENFHAYFEDSDLNFRARLAGFSAACVHDAAAWHVGSASQAGKTWWRTRQCFRNHALLVVKNMPLPLLIRFAPAIARERIHQMSMLISACRAEFGLAKALAIALQAVGSIWLAIGPAVGARWTIQQRRTADMKSIRDQLRQK